MTTLEWDKTDDRRWEAGVSHGVFYPSDGPGVVWNGLISIDESPVGGEVDTSYLDGIRYLVSVGATDYQAKLTAFSFPSELRPYVGAKQPIKGVSLMKQPKKRVHFSYQTSGDNDEYKIHLIFNALLTPESADFKTIGSSVEPGTMAWTIDATPIDIPGFRPTAHLVVDSRGTPENFLAALEEALYGTATTDPYFPTLTQLLDLYTVDV